MQYLDVAPWWFNYVGCYLVGHDYLRISMFLVYTKKVFNMAFGAWYILEILNFKGIHQENDGF